MDGLQERYETRRRIHRILLPSRRQAAKQWLVDAVGQLRGAMYPVLEELWDMEEWD